MGKRPGRDWVVLLRCPLCGAWIEQGAQSLHEELVHWGDDDGSWWFVPVRS